VLRLKKRSGENATTSGDFGDPAAMELMLFRPVILRARLSVGLALSVRATSYASRPDQAHTFVTLRTKSAALSKQAIACYDSVFVEMSTLTRMRSTLNQSSYSRVRTNTCSPGPI
jgi:hypothetical protein